ncbi:MAG: NnrS family protein [Gammaproteobacteria bacterium]|nr:NnrS family protein [Gammaproteobacteria bacterium]
MIPISDKQKQPDNSGSILFELGFRPFFLAAGIFAVVGMCLWAAIYLFDFVLPMRGMSSFAWHAHEMIYGYALAVISGFLLTAVNNWTGMKTTNHQTLALIFGLWVLVRLGFVFAADNLWVVVIPDLLFSLLLLIAMSRPLILAKQWMQMAIASKMLLLLTCNALFYLGVFGLVEKGVFWGIYGGLYLIIGLVLTMGRRVVPFFIQNGVGYKVTLFNSKWLDIPSMVLFIGFFISELFFASHALSAWLAAGLFIINAVRLVGWHTPGIWRKSLLWSIYLAFWCITGGFLLFSLAYWFGLSPYLATHAFAYGGIGLITIGMMSRVSLGHTGRDVSRPPEVIKFSFALLFLGVIIRVLMPIVAMQYYTVWIGLAQLCWIAAFAVFTITYLPVLTKPGAE